MNHDDELMDYLNGALGPVERAALDRELAASPALRAELDELQELLAGLAAALPVTPPDPALRARVLGDVERTGWARFVDAIARVWDLGVAEVRAVLEATADPARWEPGPAPGTLLFHLEGGPATAGADVGVVRFAPGTPFPAHDHGESEDYVVLQGALHDSSGRVERPGDVIHNDAGTCHTFVTDPDEDTVIAITLRGGLQLTEPPAEPTRA